MFSVSPYQRRGGCMWRCRNPDFWLHCDGWCGWVFKLGAPARTGGLCESALYLHLLLSQQNRPQARILPPRRRRKKKKLNAVYLNPYCPNFNIQVSYKKKEGLIMLTLIYFLIYGHTVGCLVHLCTAGILYHAQK